MLKAGTVAPDFEGELDDGKRFQLSDSRGEKNIVLYFYPKDFTPGCTREACAFQENYAEVEKFDAVIRTQSRTWKGRWCCSAFSRWPSTG